MAEFSKLVITNKGQALLAKMIAGSGNIEFTKVSASSTAYTDAQLEGLTSLSNVKQTSLISKVTRTNEVAIKVEAAFTNTELTAGYYMKALGLYATDPDDGEVLYAVTRETSGNCYMPAYNGITVSGAYVQLVTTVGNAENVSLEVDMAAVATIGDIKDLQKQIADLEAFIGYSSDDIFGVEVDFVNKKFTRLAGAVNRTPGAGFDDITCFGGRRRCNLTDDGRVVAYYGEEGFTTTGELTQTVDKNPEGAEFNPDLKFPPGTKVQVMVEQPIFYIKAVPVKTKNATSGKGKQYVKARFYISPTPKSGFSVPRAFYDAHGIPQDKIYLSAYEGCVYDESAGTYCMDDTLVADLDTDKLSSIAGAKPASGKTKVLTRANARKLCNNRGTGWQSHNIFAMAVTEWLFMIEYASLDPQRKVGRGVSTFTDDGSTNAAVITGATAGIGNGSGIPSGGIDGKCSVTYRGEENLWGNIWTWMDCINILAKGVNEVWVTKIGTTPVDDTTEGYERLDVHATHSNGYVSAFGIDPTHPEILIPTEASGNDTFADYVYQNYSHNGFLIAKFGGGWGSGSMCGFSLYLDTASFSRTRNIGSRLLYVPSKAVV